MAFDPGTLPQLLAAFYPVVSPANLALARAAHPDWFGDGVIFGSKGDKLRLPDGQVWDLIFGAGGPASTQRWQAIPPSSSGDAGADPFALEEGPLTLLETLVARAPDSETFRGILGQFITDTRGIDDAYARAQRPVLDLIGGDPDAILSSHEADLVSSQRADRATLSDLYALDELHAGDAGDIRTDDTARDVTDVRAAHGALSPRIDDGRREIPDEPIIVPDYLHDHPQDWPHPPKEPDANEPHR